MMPSQLVVPAAQKPPTPHVVPCGKGGGTGHVGVSPSQEAASLHGPLAPLSPHWIPAGRSDVAGQTVLRPVQYAGCSHGWFVLHWAPCSE